MADPQTNVALGGAGLVASLAGVFGQVSAEWAVVMLAAIIGAGVAASALETKTAGAVWWVMVRGVGMALLFSALVAKTASASVGMNPVDLLWPVSGLIAWQQERLVELARLLWTKRGSPP